MRKWIAGCLAIVFCVLLSVSAWAAMPPMLDKSELLTSQEQSDLNEFFGQIRQQMDITVCAVTTDSFEGMSAKAYAQDYYMEYFSGDGALLLVSLEERQWYIYTSQLCAQVIPDSLTDEIGETVAEMLRQGYYYDAFFYFGASIQELMTLKPTGEVQRNLLKPILVCLVIGLAAGGITVGVMIAKMRTVRSKPGAESYVCPGSLRVSLYRDIFLYQTLHRTAKPKSGSSGGGGGRSSGGSGGRI